MDSLRFDRVISTMLPIYLLLFCGFAMSQTVAPSDLSSDLPLPGTTRFLLNGSQTGVPTLRLYPLTEALADLSNGDFKIFNITGPLVNISPTNINSITSKDIVFISCDDSAYAGSNLKASNTFQLATQNDPAPVAVVLYSESDYHCNYSSGGASVFDATFTTVDSMIARTVASRNNSAIASIYPDLTALSSSSGSNTSTNGSSSSTTSTGPAPTTALAMIILYAITGLITGLFLIIIITGAIRAHRHPERYGPRSIIGRPRQSRAKGIARAMLETIPIVKFGDADVQPAKPPDDIELAATNTEAIAEQTNPDTPPTSEHHAHGEAAHSEEEPQTADDTAAVSDAPRPDGSDEHGTLGCSICTDDFAKGQEVRVLPCNHKFHPGCVDPWLLNVSGTCPLCRINLNPDAPEEIAEAAEAADAGSAPTTFHLPPPISPDNSSRRPLSTLFSQRSQARRMSHMTPAERLATARRLHTESGAQVQASRLSERVRERLRIRTRRQGEDSSTPVAPTEEGATTDTVPGTDSASAANTTLPSGSTPQ